MHCYGTYYSGITRDGMRFAPVARYRADRRCQKISQTTELDNITMVIDTLMTRKNVSPGVSC